MEILQKIEIFKEVVRGVRHHKELAPLLDDEGQVNWVKAAVDHIVAERLQLNEAVKQSFRLKIEGDKTTYTEWLPEASQFSAPILMGKVRQDFPGAKISVERQ